MTDETDLPATTSAVEYVGPFSSHAVVVEGWRVPLIDAEMEQGGRVRLVLDNRFGVTLSVSEAERVVPFIAQAIAVALGFRSHPQEGDEVPVQLPHVRPTRLVGMDLEPPQSNADDLP